MPRAEGLAAVASFALAGLLFSPQASASAGYPEALRSDLTLSYTPGCDLCHHAAVMPVGAADTPFAKSMIARGLMADDLPSLAAALQRMRADGVDSDGDGAEDLDELSWGGDPNHSDAPADAGQQGITYGCSTTSSRDLGGRGDLALGAFAMLIARRRRRYHAVVRGG